MTECDIIETGSDMNHSDVPMLYVEDDDIVREIMCVFLQERYPAVPVYSAASTDEGLELFRRYQHSIVMTDINLCGSNGVLLAREIRKQRPDTIIIFVTGSPDIEQISEFMGSAPCHCICKPLIYDSLFALLDRYTATSGHAERAATQTMCRAGITKIPALRRHDIRLESKESL